MNIYKLKAYYYIHITAVWYQYNKNIYYGLVIIVNIYYRMVIIGLIANIYNSNNSKNVLWYSNNSKYLL